MSLFKEKKTKKNNDNIEPTLDAKHKQILLNIDETKKSLSQHESELNIINKKYEEIDKKPLYELSDQEIDDKFNLKDKIDKLKETIKNIYNNSIENDYFLNTSHILFHYYEKKNKTTCNKTNKSTEKSVLNFFQKEQKESPIVKNDNNDKYNNMSKSDILSQYLGYTSDSYIPEIEIDDDNLCPNCKIESKVNFAEGVNICLECGYQKYILIDYDKPSYKDPPREISYFAYKRINHFNEWLAQFQAKESTEISKDIYDRIKEEIYKEQIIHLSDLTPPKLREILKKLKLNKYYEHTPHIINRLNGIPAPMMSRDTEEKLRIMFREIQTPFLKHCPKNRKNFLSYSYVLHKFVQLLELDEYLECFPLLKSKDKLHEQDLIWKKICYELHWEYIRSI